MQNYRTNSYMTERIERRNQELRERKLEKTLAYACSINDIDLIKERLRTATEAELNRKSGFYGTALHIACSDNNMEVVKLLLDAGVNLELKDVASDTALFVALEKGFEELAYLLIDARADIHAKGVHRTSVIHAACLCCSGQMVEYLINKGVSVNELASDKRSALIYTAGLSGGNLEAERVLIEHGINKEHYDTAFVEASWRGNPDIARLLLEHGANPAAINGKTGKKPETLFWICNKGGNIEEQRKRFVQVIDMLIDLGFDFAGKYKFKGLIMAYDGSPLEKAEQSNFAEAVDLINRRQGKG